MALNIGLVPIQWMCVTYYSVLEFQFSPSLSCSMMERKLFIANDIGISTLNPGNHQCRGQGKREAGRQGPWHRDTHHRTALRGHQEDGQCFLTRPCHPLGRGANSALTPLGLGSGCHMWLVGKFSGCEQLIFLLTKCPVPKQVAWKYLQQGKVRWKE